MPPFWFEGASVEINSLGHSGFRIRSKDVTLVLDPPSPEFAAPAKGVNADIICITHDHPGHNHVRGIGGQPRIIRGPGEYEIGGALITALRSFHDTKHGEERGGNTIYVIHLEDITIAHLGDLGHPLTSALKQEVVGVDILMIPVGGHSTIDAKLAADIVSDVEPSIIIPMHYGGGSPRQGQEPLDPVEGFFQVMGIAPAEPQTKLVVTRTSIPAQAQVIILTPRG